VTGSAGPPAALPGTFLASLDPSERVALETLAIRRRFPLGSMLMFEHEPSERVMILTRGRVKISSSGDDGRELMLGIRDPGDVLGELGFVDGQPRIATASALDPVQALVISSQMFRAHLETTPRLAVILLEVITRRFREATRMRTQFAASDTLGRVAARILELAERYGTRQDDAIVVAMPITHEELAAWTGASRAGVAQALQTMRELGWIVTERRRMVIKQIDAVRTRAA
jgi:CRP/FNR family cyclic AMP-dependent transcriptional regulator